MDIKTDVNTPAYTLPASSVKGETTSQQGKEATSFTKDTVSFGKATAPKDKKDVAAVGIAEKRKEASKEEAEMQEVFRKALDIKPIPQRKLQLSIEKDLNRVVFKVLDKESGDLVRQIPMPEQISISKKLRAAMEKMVDDQSGIAVSEEV